MQKLWQQQHRGQAGTGGPGFVPSVSPQRGAGTGQVPAHRNRDSGISVNCTLPPPLAFQQLQGQEFRVVLKWNTNSVADKGTRITSSSSSLQPQRVFQTSPEYQQLWSAFMHLSNSKYQYPGYVPSPFVKHFSELTDFSFPCIQCCTTFIIKLIHHFPNFSSVFSRSTEDMFWFWKRARKEKCSLRLRLMPQGNFYSRTINPLKQTCHGNAGNTDPL